MWRILRKFESDKDANLNFTGRSVAEVANGSSGAGRIFYEMPNLNVLGRELKTFGDLQMTPARLGINNGGVPVRLSFKKTDQPLEEAIRDIQQYFKDEEQTELGAAGSEARPAEVEGVTNAIAGLSPEVPGEDTEMKDVTVESKDEAGAPLTVTSSKPVAPEESIDPNQREVAFYAPPSSTIPQAALKPHDEADYEPTIAHAKTHQASLLNRAQNQRLLSDKEIEQAENEKATKLALMKKVFLNVKYPDQSSTTASFTAEETAADLYKYVSGLILAEGEPFKLNWYGRGPEVIPKDEKGSKKKLIKDLGLAGSVRINFIWEDGASEKARKAPTLKPEYLEQARPIVVPEIAAVETKDEEFPSAVDKGKGKETSAGRGKADRLQKLLGRLSKK